MVLEFCEDPWGPYRGKYPDPTDREYNIICHYLIPFGISTFDPTAASENDYYKRRATEAASVAICDGDRVEWGKRYELVSRDKTVWVRENRTFLLTLKLKELDADADVIMVDADAAVPVGVLKTILAMVYAPHHKLRLREWKCEL